VIEVRLVDRPVVHQSVAPPPRSSGGECVFLGRTREERHPVHGHLSRLYYEAYRTMAERVLRDLSAQAATTFGCEFIAVEHALGDVAVGEASVLVRVAAPHRAAAFDACRFLIDRLKAEAPIWKRECWEDGSTWSPGAPVVSDKEIRS
jgi:molybdopterin synthase catalytic subunit